MPLPYSQVLLKQYTPSYLYPSILPALAKHLLQPQLQKSDTFGAHATSLRAKSDPGRPHDTASAPSPPQQLHSLPMVPNPHLRLFWLNFHSPHLLRACALAAVRHHNNPIKKQQVGQWFWAWNYGELCQWKCTSSPFKRVVVF